MIAIIISMMLRSYRSAQLLIGLMVSAPSGLMALFAYGLSGNRENVLAKIPVVNLIPVVLAVFRGTLNVFDLVYSAVCAFLAIWLLWKYSLYYIRNRII